MRRKVAALFVASMPWLLPALLHAASVDSGKVVSRDDDKLVIANAAGRPVSYRLDQHVPIEVWRGKTFFDLNVLRVGDQVEIRFHPEGDNRVLEKVWAKADRLEGKIVAARPGEFEIRWDAGQNPWLNRRAGHERVSYTPDTHFDHCGPEELAVGREVDAIGKLGRDRLTADWIQVYRPPEWHHSDNDHDR